MTLVLVVCDQSGGVMAADSMVTEGKGGVVAKTWRHGHVA